MTSETLTAIWSRTTLPLRLLANILRHARLARSRRALKHLDDHLLRDIGLTRHEAKTEASRSDWNAPLHWRS